MADSVTPKRRSEIMSNIRAKGMKPEMAVRRITHAMGYRYRLHRKDLPGKPDLVFPSRRKVIFIHGCFWHQHTDPACKIARRPRSNQDYWLPKLERNAARDAGAPSQSHGVRLGRAGALGMRCQSGRRHCRQDSQISGTPVIALRVRFRFNTRAILGASLRDRATLPILLRGLGPSGGYTPPEGEDVLRSKLANWERYIHEAEEIDPLIRLAVMHYQFEAIHPFGDGNGRTGRVLNLLYLVDKGLLDIPVLYLSRHIIRNKALYYRYLLEVTTRQDWEAWILFILEAVRTTAEWTTAKIRAIRELLDETGAAIRQRIPKIYSRELAELIFVNPYCRIGDVVKADIPKRQTAAVYLKALAAEGLLKEIKAGRENLYINPPLLTLLSERT